MAGCWRRGAMSVMHSPPGAYQKAPYQYHHPESNYNSTSGAKGLTVEFVIFRSDRTTYRAFVEGLLHLSSRYNSRSKLVCRLRTSLSLVKSSDLLTLFSLPDKPSQNVHLSTNLAIHRSSGFVDLLTVCPERSLKAPWLRLGSRLYWRSTWRWSAEGPEP